MFIIWWNHYVITNQHIETNIIFLLNSFKYNPVQIQFKSILNFKVGGQFWRIQNGPSIDCIDYVATVAMSWLQVDCEMMTTLLVETEAGWEKIILIRNESLFTFVYSN